MSVSMKEVKEEYNLDYLFDEVDSQATDEILSLSNSRMKDIKVLVGSAKKTLEENQISYQETMAKLKKDLDATIDSLDSSYDEFQKKADQKIKTRKESYENSIKDLQQDSEKKIDDFLTTVLLSLQTLDGDFLNKYDTFSSNYSTWDRAIKHFPNVVSIGSKKVDSRISPNEKNLPLIVPFLDTQCISFDVNDESHEIMQLIALKTIAALPLGGCHFIGIDAMGTGRNITKVTALDDKIIGHDKKQVNQRSINDVIHKLVQTTSDLVDKVDGYATLKEYNAVAKDVPEPYRIVMITDFPESIDPSNFKDLKNLIENGPRVGIYTMISISKSIKGYDKEIINEIIEKFKKINLNDFNKMSVLQKASHFETLEYAKSLANTMNEQASKAKKPIITFESVVREKLWTKSSQKSIEAPLGRAGAEGIQSMVLGDDAHHVLLAGATGSGKTVLLHTLINSFAHNYSPEELQMYLLDYKEGTEFSVYKNLPHMAVLSLSSERLFGLNILKGVQEELNRRGTLFKATSGSNNINEYRERSGEKLHRLIVIIDEFQVLLSGTDKIEMTAREIFEDIVKRGRSFGIHLILSTQSLAGLHLNTILGQVQIRIGMRMGGDDSELVLGYGNTAAKFLDRGEAIFNKDNGKIESNIKFGVAFMDNDAIANHVASLKNISEQQNISLESQRVFDTNLDADIEQNAYFKSKHPVGRFSDVYIGEPNFVSDAHVSFRIKKDIPANVLIIGEPKERICSLVGSMLFSLSLSMDENSEFYTINLLSEDDEYKDELNFVTKLPVKSYIGHDLYELENAIDNLDRELSEREKNRKNTYNKIVLTIVAIQNARSLRPVSSFEKSPYIDKLFRLLKDGAASGIHIIIQSDKYNRINEFVQQEFFQEFESAQIILKGSDSHELFESQNIFSDKIRSEHIGILKGNQNKFDVDEFKIYPLSSVKSLYDSSQENQSKEAHPKLFNVQE